MHDCPNCGTYCDCDGEDIHNDAASETCRHGCEPDDDDYEEFMERKSDKES